LPGWTAAFEAALGILLPEAYRNHGAMIEEHPELVGEAIANQITLGRQYGAGEAEARQAQARQAQARWKAELAAAFERVELLATPTLAGYALPLAQPEAIAGITRTMELN